MLGESPRQLENCRCSGAVVVSARMDEVILAGIARVRARSAEVVVVRPNYDVLSSQQRIGAQDERADILGFVVDSDIDRMRQKRRHSKELKEAVLACVVA